MGRKGGGAAARVSRPPALARWIVACVCPDEDRAFVLSDLAEEYDAKVGAEGRFRARWWYRAQVARSLIPCVARRLRDALGAAGSSGGLALHGLGADVRYASRRLVATPVQVVVTVLSLGIGIGLTTSVFAVANAFLMQSPGGLTDTDGLVALYTSDERGRLYDASSYPDVDDVAREADVFEGVSAIRPGVVFWDQGESSRRVIVEIVNGNYFDVLRADPVLGRSFAPEETVVGSAGQVTVISYDLWQTRFGGDPSVLGRALRLDGRDFTVIGVAPEGLLGRLLRLKVDAWLPVGVPGGIYHSTPGELVDRSAREYMVYGRLRRGVSVEQAQARLNVVAARLRSEYPDAWVDDRGATRTLTVLPEEEARVPPDARAALAGAAGFLMAGTVVVLFIACINVAGLFMARAIRRRREIVVRIALGAGRGRVVRLLLVEALLLGLAGGGVGLALASFTARYLRAIPFPLDVPLSFGVDVDLRVLLFALGTALATCVAFGLVPALRASRPDLVVVLKGDEGGALRRRFGARGVLVTLQVACSVVFLVATGLCLRTTGVLASFDSGLDPDGIALASWRNGDEGAGEDAIRQEVLGLADRLAASPDIAAVAVASSAELSTLTDHASAKLRVDGFEPGPGQDVVVARNVVTPGYFEMVGLRPVRGRVLEPADDARAAAVALVNESFVRTYWPGESGLGRRFAVVEARAFGKPYASPERAYEVVGVLPDVRATPDQDPRPYVWTSFLQDYSPLVIFHVRGREDAAGAVPELRRIVQEDPRELQLVSARTYADLVAFNLIGQRLAVTAFGWCGAFALLLALMGLYGMISFAVGQRMREMAIRQAVGASRGTVLLSVLLDGLRLTGIGVALGLAVVVPGAALARSALYGVSPVDPPALLGSLGVLLVAALAATLLPARRAALADPMRILRED